MHKIFGTKENERYYDRRGAYIIPIKEGKVGVVETPKGYFLLGGGLENDETDIQCITRECLEEAGYQVEIKEKICTAESFSLHPTIGYFHPIQVYYTGVLIKQIKEPDEKDHIFKWIEYEKVKGKMFSEMQSWAIEQVWNMK